MAAANSRLVTGTGAVLNRAKPTHGQSAVVIGVGIVSVVYGALVALAQTDLKRMIAYTSINHMGYVAVGVAAAAVERALQVDRAACRESVAAYSWEACTRQFVANLAVNPRPVGARGFRNRAD